MGLRKEEAERKDRQKNGQLRLKLKTLTPSPLLDEVHRKTSLRDKEMAEGKIRGLVLKGLAPAVIKEKLGKKRIPVDNTLIQKVYDRLEMTKHDQINILIEQKMARKHVPLTDEAAQDKLKRRILSFLRTKGHDHQEARNLIEDYFRRSS